MRDIDKFINVDNDGEAFHQSGVIVILNEMKNPEA
jgi:hypothetical protein